MQHLFRAWESFASAVKAASHVLLLSDYDGTLTPIVGRPEEAILAPGVKEKLRALAEKSSFSVGIISGRALAEIESMVGIERIYYAGNHGLEIEGPGLKFVSPTAEVAREQMKELAWQLAANLGGIEGIIIEDKGLSLSVHYRLIRPGVENQAAEIFHQLTEPLSDEGKIKITSGKKVWEVRPPIDWHKGKAVEAIRREIKTLLNLEQPMTIYLGDDTTDEDAFRALQQPDGWSIFVGADDASSNADYFLSSTSEVEDFLSKLAELR